MEESKEELQKRLSELDDIEKQLEEKKQELHKEKEKNEKLQKLMCVMQKESLYQVAKTDIRSIENIVFKHAKYSNENDKKRIMNEIEKHTKISEGKEGKEFFCKIFGSIELPEKYTLLLEKCDSDLKKHVGKKKSTLRQKLELLRQCCYAMKILHGNNLVHLDFKMQNVFTKKEDGKYQVKLGDFEEVRDADPSNHERLIGTYNYIDYNIVDYVRDGKKPDNFLRQRDIYSFGIVCFAILYLKTPFGTFGKKQRKKDFDFENSQMPYAVFDHLKNSPEEDLWTLLTDRVNTKKIPEPLNDIIKMCVDKDESKRPTFSELEGKIADFIKGMDPEEITEDLTGDRDDLLNKIEERDSMIRKLKEKLTTMETSPAGNLSEREKKIDTLEHKVEKLTRGHITELKSYKNPNDLVESVVREVLLVVGHGEDPRVHEEWDIMKSLISHKILKMDYNSLNLSKKSRDRIKALLGKVTVQDCYKTSVAVGVFYEFLEIVNQL